MIEAVIKSNNVYSWLNTSNKNIKTLLHNALRFRPKNFWHSSAYKRKVWDGYKDFFDDKTGRFYTGLLPEVKKALNVKGVEYNIVSEIKRFPWKNNNIDQNFLTEWLPEGVKPFKLHDYQYDLVNQCFKHDRGIVIAPTSSGKTFCMISLLKSLPAKTPTLFLTKNSGLVHQNWEAMKLWGVENLGRWYDKYKEKNYIMCATIHHKTFDSLADLLPYFKVLIVDEVHDCVSDVPVEAYKKMVNANVRIGFSATAFRWWKEKIEEVHKWTVKSHFGAVFKTSTTESGVLTTKDLQDRDIVSTSDCTFYKVKHPDIRHEPFQDAVKLGIGQNYHLHEMIVKLAQNCEGRTLIIVERIEQGEQLKQLIVGSKFIQGKTKIKDRQPLLDSLCQGDKFIVIAMRHIITAGINVKIHDLINASGGEGAHNIIQLMGRGLRKADDKKLLRYHDFLFLINDYLKEDSEWRIEVLKKENHQVIIKDCV